MASSYDSLDMGSTVQKPQRVAVIGLGLTGIGALKNLLEAGFDATGFEQNEYIGGLWSWTTNSGHTSVLKTTRANVTKQRSCYTDFPFPDDVPDYPQGSDVANYIYSYAEKFGLSKHWRLGVEIQRIDRKDDKWSLRIREQSHTGEEASKDEHSEIEYFDKVLVTTGPFKKAFIPPVDGSEEWPGQILHAQDFKSAEVFKGKNVVVVGLCNTGGDVVDELSAGGAEKIWISHRSGARIFKRHDKNGTPIDRKVTRRAVGIMQRVVELFPGLVGTIGDYFADRKIRSENPLMKDEWKLLPAPPLLNSPAMISDTIIEHLLSGRVTSMPGIKRFILSDDDPKVALTPLDSSPPPSSGSIEFNDGTILHNIDAVIFATGYYFDYSILSPSADPTDPEQFPHPEWTASQHVNGLDYPRLYQGLLSTVHPDSLAFIGPVRGHDIAAFSNADLTTQAIAQIWLGNYPLPNKQEIQSWCDKNYQANLHLLTKWRLGKVGLQPRKLEKWLNAAAGNGLNENLGWGWAGWKFWWKERELYGLIMDGINTPFVYRLFESPRGERGRKSWEGARDAILQHGKKK